MSDDEYDPEYPELELYTGNNPITIEDWLVLFEQDICYVLQLKSNTEMVRKLVSYLGGKALDFFAIKILNRMKTIEWTEVKELFTKRFNDPNIKRMVPKEPKVIPIPQLSLNEEPEYTVTPQPITDESTLFEWGEDQALAFRDTQTKSNQTTAETELKPNIKLESTDRTTQPLRDIEQNINESQIDYLSTERKQNETQNDIHSNIKSQITTEFNTEQQIENLIKTQIIYKIENKTDTQSLNRQTNQNNRIIIGRHNHFSY